MHTHETAPRTGDIARRAFDVVAAAQSVRSLAELETVAGSELRRFGFGVVIAVEVIRRGAHQSIRPVFGDTTAPSIVHYLAQGHDAHCPVIGAACSTPRVWRELKARPLGPREQQVFDELGDFAMHEGHVIVVQRDRHPPVAVSLAGAAVALDAPDERAAVHLLSTYYGLIGARLAQTAAAPSPVLSARQLEVLCWVREGKSSFDIGEIMGLSARTIDSHLATACQRLGVRTRVQAVVEASLHGLISL